MSSSCEGQVGFIKLCPFRFSLMQVGNKQRACIQRVRFSMKVFTASSKAFVKGTEVFLLVIKLGSLKIIISLFEKTLFIHELIISA